MTPAPPNMIDPELRHALGEFASMQWCLGVRAEEIDSSQRITPFSVAVTLDSVEDDEELGTGRLILLHDSAGSENWKGRFRLVSHVRAEANQEMVTDPLLSEAVWSQLTDVLFRHGAVHRTLAGAATAPYGRGPGKLVTHQAEMEIRASWTPILDNRHKMTVQFKTWQDLLGHISGCPPLPRGVMQFPGCS